MNKIYMSQNILRKNSTNKTYKYNHSKQQWLIFLFQVCTIVVLLLQNSEAQQVIQYNNCA